MDLRTMTDGELSELRQGLAVELDRRRKVAQLPDDLAAMTRDAVKAGCSPEVLRARVDEALSPDQQAMAAETPA